MGGIGFEEMVWYGEVSNTDLYEKNIVDDLQPNTKIELTFWCVYTSSTERRLGDRNTSSQKHRRRRREAEMAVREVS